MKNPSIAIDDPKLHRQADDAVAVPTASSARDLGPVAYAIADAVEVRRELVDELTRMLRAGALDAETIGALSPKLDRTLDRWMARFDDQRASHEGVIAAIITFAKRNLDLAESSLRAARRRVVEARAAHRDALAAVGRTPVEHDDDNAPTAA